MIKITPLHSEKVVTGKPEDMFTFSSHTHARTHAHTQTQSYSMLTHRPWAASGLSEPRWGPAWQREKKTAALPTWSGHSSRTRSWRQETRWLTCWIHYQPHVTWLGHEALFHTPASDFSHSCPLIHKRIVSPKAKRTDSRLHCEIERSRNKSLRTNTSIIGFKKMILKADFLRFGAFYQTKTIF